MMDDTISRQAAIDALGEEPEVWSGKDEYDVGLRNQWRDDVDAIKALPSAQHGSVESVANDIYNTDATDTINRSDALKVCEGYNGRGYTWASIADGIRHLPSAQPEIVRCKDCKWHDFGKPDMVYCQSLDCFVSEDFFCKDGERSVENGSAIVPPSWTDKSDHS